MKIVIGKSAVDALTVTGKQYTAWDKSLTGFGVRVGAAGTKTFIVSRRIGSGRAARPARRTVGRYGTMTPAEARSRATEMLAAMADGRDPEAAAAEALADSVGAVWANYADQHLTNLKHREDAAGRRRLMATYILPAWAHRSMDSITVLDVSKVLDSIARTSPANAMKLRRTLSHFQKWAAQRGMVPNVVASLAPTYKIASRSRVLSTTELAWIWHAAGEHLHPIVAAYLRAMILTGQRKAQMLALRWAKTGDWWSWPKEIMKNGRDHRIPAMPAMAALLADMPRIDRSPLVFSRDGKVPIGDLSKAKAILEAALPDLDDWRIHDFRRSLSTWCADNDVGDPMVVEAVLAHADTAGARAGVVGIYNRATYERRMGGVLGPWQDAIMAEVNRQAPAYREWRDSGERLAAE